MKRTITVVAVTLLFLPVFCFAQPLRRATQSTVVQLPEPKTKGKLSLEQALTHWRSVAKFATEPLDFVQLGQLAWAGQGIVDKQTGIRTAPSPGGVYPLRLYLATPRGLFLYNPAEHYLESVLESDVRGALAAAVSARVAVAEAPCDIIIAADVRAVTSRFGVQGRKLMFFEAGRVAQNIQLQAASMELGTVSVGLFDPARVRRVCNLAGGLEPLYIICAGRIEREAFTPQVSPQGSQLETSGPKKAVLIIASDDFRDEELFNTRAALANAGVQTVIASSKKGLRKGMLGGTVQVNLMIYDINVDDYDAVVFIGGTGAREYFNNRRALEIAQQAVAKNKVLGAICIAPTILANAGVLNGRRATSFPSEQNRLQRAGAVYTGVPVQRDGLIVTAAGPQASVLFGQAIAQMLRRR